MWGRRSCLLQSAGGKDNRILLASELSSMRIICPNRVSRHDWNIAVSGWLNTKMVYPCTSVLIRHTLVSHVQCCYKLSPYSKAQNSCRAYKWQWELCTQQNNTTRENRHHDRNVIPDVMKKCEDSPKIPTVPGPVISARTLTSENAPLMTPKPKPDTAKSPKLPTILLQLSATSDL